MLCLRILTPMVCLLCLCFSVQLLTLTLHAQTEVLPSTQQTQTIEDLEQKSTSAYYKKLSDEARDEIIEEVASRSNEILEDSDAVFEASDQQYWEHNKQYIAEVSQLHFALRNWIFIEKDKSRLERMYAEYFRLYSQYPLNPTQAFNLFRSLVRSGLLPDSHAGYRALFYDVQVNSQKFVHQIETEKQVGTDEVAKEIEHVKAIQIDLKVKRPLLRDQTLGFDLYPVNPVELIDFLKKEKLNLMEWGEPAMLRAFIQARQIKAERVEIPIKKGHVTDYPMYPRFHHRVNQSSCFITHVKFEGQEVWQLVNPGTQLVHLYQMNDSLNVYARGPENTEARIVHSWGHRSMRTSLFSDGTDDEDDENGEPENVQFRELTVPVNRPAHLGLTPEMLNVNHRILVYSETDIQVWASRPQYPEHPSAYHVTTDRVIYRPGDEVNFKIIRRDYVGDTVRLPEVRSSVQLVMRTDEGRELTRVSGKWSEMGTWSGMIPLSDLINPGSYILHIHEGGAQTPARMKHRVVVKAYRKSDMQSQVELLEWNEQRLKFRVHASYLSGGYVKQPKVEAVLYAHDTFLDRIHRDDHFRSVPFYWKLPLKPERWWMGVPHFYQDHTGGLNDDVSLGYSIVTMSNGVVSADGKHVVFTLDLKEEEIDVSSGDSNKWQIEVEVMDEIGQVSSKVVMLPEIFPNQKAESVRIAMSWDRKIYRNDEPISATLVMTDINGKPVSNANVTVNLSELEGLDIPRYAQFVSDSDSLFGGGRLKKRIVQGPVEASYQRMDRRIVKTDNDGRAKITFKKAQIKKGVLRLQAIYESEQYRIMQVDQCLIADPLIPSTVKNDYFSDFQYKLLKNANEQLLPISDLLMDRVLYNAGDTMRLLVNQSQAMRGWVVIVGHGFNQMIEVPQSMSSFFEVKIPETFSTGVLRIVHYKQLSDDPYGWVGVTHYQVHVDNPKNQIVIDVNPDRSTYGPGEKIKLQVKTTNDGQPVKSELEIAIVDDAMFQLAPHHAVPIERVFRPEFTLYTNSIFGWKSAVDYVETHYTKERAEHEVYHVSGIFGGGTESTTISAATRFDFKDTAYYVGRIMTDDQGMLDLEIPLPDDLTRWRVVVRAVSGTTLFGERLSEILTKKPITARVIGARYYSVGDQAQLRAVVHNHTDQEQRLNAVWQMEGVTVLSGDKARVIVLGPGEHVVIKREIEVDDVKSIRVHFSASNLQVSDTIEITRVVYPIAAPATLDGAVMVKKNWEHTIELPDHQIIEPMPLQLSIVSSDHAVIQSALPYLAKYPYGCVEQTMSRFLPALVAARAMKKQGLDQDVIQRKLPGIVSRSVERLQHHQHDDGAWGWWRDSKASDWMTAYVLWGLLEAREAGYEVPDAMINEGLYYLATRAGMKWSKPFRPDNDTDTLFAGASAWDNIKDSKEMSPLAIYVLSKMVADMPDIILISPKDEDGLSTAYRLKHGKEVQMQRLAPGDSREGLTVRIQHSLDTSWMVLAGYHAVKRFLLTKPSEDRIAGRRTQFNALNLIAIYEMNPDDPRVFAFRQALLKARRGAAWASTLDTGYAIMALSQITNAGEPESFRLVINGESQVMKPGMKSVPFERFKDGKLALEIKRDSDQPLYVSWSMQYKTDDVTVIGRQTEADLKSHLIFVDQNDKALEPGKTWHVKRGDVISFSMKLDSDLEGFNEGMVILPMPAGLEPVLDIELEGNLWKAMVFDHEVRVPFENGSMAEHDQLRFRATQNGVFHASPSYLFDMYNPQLSVYGKPIKIIVTEDGAGENE